MASPLPTRNETGVEAVDESQCSSAKESEVDRICRKGFGQRVLVNEGERDIRRKGVKHLAQTIRDAKALRKIDTAFDECRSKANAQTIILKLFELNKDLTHFVW
ncbi:hypothetical protein TNIN_457241 [Trichonephila inaurata madagascariensis]|uniref:Uncharacterized protein n=1 Tax=Trichonephila inaurata madagascariensis TaxID=2747483 RepID=A0A8X6X9B5_9ARAC|nr:hypothetical protein TNIN_457241 [Trichonephila inaurata madagascariensis]